MTNQERRRKLKQAYELLCLGTEIAQDVLAGVSESEIKDGKVDRVEELGYLLGALDECNAEFSLFSMEDGPFAGE